MTANFYCFSQNGTHTFLEDWRLESKYLFLYQTLLINIQSALLASVPLLLDGNYEQ